MGITNRRWYHQVAELMFDWVDRTVTAVERSPSEEELRTEQPWATELTGEVAFAFEVLNQALDSEERRTALEIVLYWGMAGLMDESLNAIGSKSLLAERFRTYLRVGGYVPYVMESPDEDDAGSAPDENEDG